MASLTTVQPELIAQKLAQLAYAKALRDTKWDACNPLGRQLIQYSIDRLCHDLHKLGAEGRARMVLG